MTVVKLPDRSAGPPHIIGPKARDYIWLSALLRDFITFGIKRGSREWVVEKLTEALDQLKD